MSLRLDYERQGQMKLPNNLNLTLLAALMPSWGVRFQLKKTGFASAQHKQHSSNAKRQQQKASQAQKQPEHKNQLA